MNKINVISCFDGMSCGQESLKQLEIPVEKYYASELDKYAIAVTQHNYPNTIQMGDVTKWKEWDIEWSEIDLVFGGSPCQGFSFAGKQLAFDDPRSKLFFVFVDIINHIKKVNPDVKFLLENVRMKQEYLDIISEHMGVQPVKINSALVSAQNRVRYYWTNIAELEQPEDKGILLKDILETGNETHGAAIRGRYLPNGKTEQRLELNGKEKSNSITTVQKDSLVTRCIQVGKADLKGHDYIKRVYSPNAKAPTLNANGGGNLEPKVALTQHGNKLRHPEATKKGYAEVGVGEGLDLTFPKSKTRRGRAMIEKSNCLTAVSCDYGVVEKPKLTDTGLQWRKLTPLECERLQTVPDNYTLVPWQKRMMSNSQRYKMLGNGWTIEVIKHIFKNLL